MKIKVNDQVKILAGKDKGKTGTVLKTLKNKDKVVVDGINIAKRHQKPNNANENGGIIEFPAPIHVSNVKKIEEKGIKIVHITLHVGLGTFRPVNVEDVTKHVMHKEHYIMTKEAADTLNEIREKGGKIYAVGTTSVRTLETIMQTNDKFVPASGDTSIFIYPGFKFKGIDGLITNFHLPKSTLVMLVSAFSSKENILNAYNEAVKMKYRFFSFGDAMLIK